MDKQPKVGPSTSIRLNALSTTLLCMECAIDRGFNYAERIGGTFAPDTCPKCGKELYLGEYWMPAPAHSQEPNDGQRTIDG